MSALRHSAPADKREVIRKIGSTLHDIHFRIWNVGGSSLEVAEGAQVHRPDLMLSAFSGIPCAVENGVGVGQNVKLDNPEGLNR